MRRSFLAAAIVPALAFAAVSLVNTREAAAGPHLDFDADLGAAFQSAPANRVDFSAGGGLRLGYRFGFHDSPVWIQPEIGGHYMHLGFNDLGGYDYAATVNGGIKLGLQGIVQPNAFAHLGLGILGSTDGYGNSSGFLGPAFDVGLGLDFRLARGFTLGAQVAFNGIAVPTDSEPMAKWMSFGLTAGFHFGEPRPRPVYVRRVYY